MKYFTIFCAIGLLLVLPQLTRMVTMLFRHRYNRTALDSGTEAV